MNSAGVSIPTSLFPDISNFPNTRYQGSKRKLTSAILRTLDGLSFNSVLDAFGGTGAMSYAFKCAGKVVTYNDILAFNRQIGLALIENDRVQLGEEDITNIGVRHDGAAYEDFIERTFDEIYFTGEENRWLDIAIANIRALRCQGVAPACSRCRHWLETSATFHRLETGVTQHRLETGATGAAQPGIDHNCHRQAMAWFAMFQSAMAKRPYNLFHRANLYMRTAEVERGFGNKASWDRSFDEHFATFARQANAAVIDGGATCRVLCQDVFDIEPEYDLVYIDPPYINAAGVGVDYREFYHFLEGMVDYERWAGMIDWKSKHRRLVPVDDPWSDPKRSLEMFERLFERFRKSILVVSYRSDGTPRIAELEAALKRVKGDVRVVELDRYQYALSTRNQTREMLFIV